MEIKKPDFMMPIMPEIFANALPIPVPQMEWNKGIIPNFLHNVKLKQVGKASEIEAQIDENKLRSTKAKLTMIQDMMAYGVETQLRFKRAEHETKMMEAEEHKAQLEGQVLYFQAKNEEMDFKMKQKAYEEQHGTDKT